MSDMGGRGIEPKHDKVGHGGGGKKKRFGVTYFLHGPIENTLNYFMIEYSENYGEKVPRAKI